MSNEEAEKKDARAHRNFLLYFLVPAFGVGLATLWLMWFMQTSINAEHQQESLLARTEQAERRMEQAERRADAALTALANQRADLLAALEACEQQK
jgi:hypothetical protein